MIRNPNDIVDRLVAGFSNAAGERLLGIAMYGSAVSHEYRPGKSDVNILVVLADTSAVVLRAIAPVQVRWMRRGVAAPLYLTPRTIASSLESFPVEFLDMRHAYRVLYGEDFLAPLQLRAGDLLLQCERELAGLTLHLTREFVHACRDPRRVGGVLASSLRRLLPVFKAIVVLSQQKIPSATAEIVAAVEDLTGLGASVLSEINNRPYLTKDTATRKYELFTRAVEIITGHIERLHEGIEAPEASCAEGKT
ncbi:MAG: hypothetical protein JW913_04435 [Chitinispirillaceae bacterium]|nr:hypothetical protein [Chitinispirillaceae bacterium]